MYCYDEKGELLGVIACIPTEGEEHMWGDITYVCTGEVTTDKGCKENGMIFKEVLVSMNKVKEIANMSSEERRSILNEFYSEQDLKELGLEETKND